MNFNYDLATWIDYFVGAFICCIGMFLSGKILLEEKFSKVKFYHYLSLILFSIFIVINTLVFDNITKIFGTLIVWFCIFKIIFSKNTTQSLSYSIVSYIIFALGEITLMILISILSIFGEISFFNTIIKTIYGNILVVIFTCMYCLLLKKYINIKFNKFSVEKNNIIYAFLLGIVTMFILLSTLYQLSLNNWIFNYQFILNTVIFLGCLILSFVLFKQYLENKEISNKYILLNDYLKTSAELIEKYGATTHKYKNNLIIIKGYMKSDMKEANKYIDSLLDKMENKKYSWVKKINYIPVDTIRYLIYYKLSKAETENLKIIVDVSNELKTLSSDIINSKKIHILADIVGEFFDNAIYASSESKEKELNLVIYKEKNSIVFTLSNTYKGDIDLNLITNNGFTTKGKGHGFGLYDIEKTIRRNNWIKIEYELLDDYFVVNLKIEKTSLE